MEAHLDPVVRMLMEQQPLEQFRIRLGSDEGGRPAIRYQVDQRQEDGADRCRVIVEPLSRLLAPARSEPALITTQELRLLVEVSQRRGVIDDDESALLQEVLELGQRKVRDAMVPRVDLQAFDIDGEPASLRRFMQEHRLKKVPVYRSDIDHIVGLVYAKSLFCTSSRI